MRRPSSIAPPEQLQLFDSAALSAAAEPERAPQANHGLAERLHRLVSLAARLPPHVRFGTSSWSFPGWAGLVFPPGMSESELARNGLAHYARHPLMRTVGIDRSYYAPLSGEQLKRYSQQLPEQFPCCAKAPQMFTSSASLSHDRSRRGQPNANFLDARKFLDVVATPFLKEFADHLGPTVLQFAPTAPDQRLPEEEFAQRLDAFLCEMPAGLPVAVELRDRRLLTRSYLDVLASRGAAHTYSYWTDMPMIEDQMRRIPVDVSSAPFVVVRLMLRPGTRYATRRRDFAPFDQILDPDPEMRRQVLDLVKAAGAAHKTAFVLVNNKAEGSAPLTIEALAQLCVE
jgi:uncharacterized protein YecE (DUF72 family)